MTTKPPAKVKPEEPDAPVSKIYAMVEELKDSIPVLNERYRLGFCLHRFYIGEAGTIKEAVYSAKPDSSTIELDELASIFSKKFEELKLIPQDR
jgi:hypothetical protein